MCKHADQTEEYIYHLLENVYPCLELKIQNAINCSYLKVIKNEQKEYLLELMQSLRIDFNSLVSCEEKLVFPSVMKIFNAKTSKEVPMPNLLDLMQLTRSKEHKIMIHVNSLTDLLKMNSWEHLGIKQQDLAESFTMNFVKEKYRWNKMIEDRLNACTCFRSNIFKGLGFDLNDEQVLKQG